MSAKNNKPEHIDYANGQSLANQVAPSQERNFLQNLLQYRVWQQILGLVLLTLLIKIVYQRNIHKSINLHHLNTLLSNVVAHRNRDLSSAVQSNQNHTPIFGELEFDPEDANPFNKGAMILFGLFCALIFPFVLAF
ncbi:hypothetical protein AWRI3579_g759 [Hanseniaspora osmophila]|uniref:Uncharacterized protein n=1 Tax=Hanseniaspora osmophila TaxID=56408 RepID=A0A1E5RNX9_9ASCO|nr:hypothetical protein AWRI3579_g759 [Hanseniaspora osmophila]